MDAGRVVEPFPLVALAVAAIVSGGMGWRRGGGRRAAEASALALAGGFLARSLVALLLVGGEDSTAIGLFVGWAFFFVNGLVDSVLLLFGVRLLTLPGVLLWSALVVGTFTGAAHGAGAVYDWRDRRGRWAFLSDVTWSLSSSTTGGILHVVNLLIGTRAPDERTGGVRFSRGFHPPGRANFAFTQGAVMSNLDRAPGTPLFAHERTHVRQARWFGPLYTISYLGWMLVMVVPAIVHGARHRRPLGYTEAWCYYSNPWEVWGYHVQTNARVEGERVDRRIALSHGCCLSQRTAVRLGVPYVVLCGLVLVVLGLLSL